MLLCTSCKREQSFENLDFECSSCGGILRLDNPPVFDPAQVDDRTQGMWRYCHTFPLAQRLKRVSLGEGRTPLVELDVRGHAVHFKLESLNPTGSFKDRGTSVLSSLLNTVNVTEAVEDSSGNAGASLAAYCARAKIKTRIFVPESASPAKIRQIEVYGATAVRISGNRSDVTLAAKDAAKAGTKYASHVYNPIGLAGSATTAFEIWEQFEDAPGTVIVPIGQGTLLLGLDRGFKSLQRAKLISRLPRLVAVQAEVCAPLWRLLHPEPSSAAHAPLKKSIAEGISIPDPVRGGEVRRALKDCSGEIRTVSEDAIRQGVAELAHYGIFVEYTSAVVWPVLQQLLTENSAGPIVVVLTGNGLKNPSAS